jgi:DNA (cytosine-5)-methyltransferase 1
MLDEGFRAACEFFGQDYRTVCYVEREAAAAGQLVTLMEAGAVDPAPIWSDLLTFNGSAWRGRLDCITAGFPCQPHSMAGKRKGTADERWIWPAIAGIIRDVSPRLVFLENVRGLLSSGGFEAAVGSLAGIGFDIEWGVLRASDVGASHQRERVFILAYRKGERLGEAGRDFERSAQWIGWSGAALADPESERDGSWRMPVRAEEKDAFTPGAGWNMGYANSTRPQRRFIEHGERSGERTSGAASAQLFAPGPLDHRWEGIIADSPHLRPATEPGVCMLVDGLAYLVDESRSHQLRQVGNGVVALQAASAAVQLARRAGIFG